MGYKTEYSKKLISAEAAARLVKSGDWVDYATGALFPSLCDGALAKRRDELYDVKIRGNLINGPIAVAECDPTHEHFVYSSWHLSAYERSLADSGQIFYNPMLFRNLGWYYKNNLSVNVAFIGATPIDEKGFFNFSVGTGVAMAIAEAADIVVIEVNEELPRIYGGKRESIHISEVDYIVEGEHEIIEPPMRPPEVRDLKIAEHILPHIKDGASLQLGIGGIPTALSSAIAGSGLRDLGMHTEFCTDAYLDLHEAGVLTNKRKKIDEGKGVLAISAVSKRVFSWLNENPGIAIYPIEYVNDPYVMSRLDNFISINSCIAVDLYGQISSESAGLRQISGTGGQLDFVSGAPMSEGGASFICLHSTRIDKNGSEKSNIVPQFNGEIITAPRSAAHMIVTEHGCVNLAGRTTWERAELLISIAAPEFREELIKKAQTQRIWRKSNKK